MAGDQAFLLISDRLDRRLLVQPRLIAAPIIAILRDDSHLERVQATVLGAAHLIVASANNSDLSGLLELIIRSIIAQDGRTDTLTPLQNVQDKGDPPLSSTICHRNLNNCQVGSIA